MKTHNDNQRALHTVHQFIDRNMVAIRFTALAAILLSLTAFASADTIHVPDDFPEIQFAIIVAEDGDEILVAPGTYTEQIDFLGKAITVKSTEGPEKTIIDAEGTGSVVKCVNGEGLDTILDGFTITGGTGTSIGDDKVGGGMYNVSASPTVINCAFFNNLADFGGAMHNEDSSAQVTDCDFTENSAAQHGGGMYNIDSSPTVITCTFSGNTAENTFGGAGGGMLNANSSPMVAECMFENNTADFGAGMFNSNSSLKAVDCTFSGNIATDREPADGGTGIIFTGNFGSSGGGMFNSISDLTVENCVFENNTADDGGGMLNDGSSPTVVECTFSGNIADSGGGMRNLSGSNPMIANSNFCENVPDHIVGNWTDFGDNCLADSCFQCIPCPEDINADGEVTVGDLLVLLAFWHTNGPGSDIAEPDDFVNVSDLLGLLAAWGACQ